MEDGYGDEDWNVEMDDTLTLNRQGSIIRDVVTVISAQNIRSIVESQIERWDKTFYLGFDKMLMVAMHYKWSEDKMNGWFDEQESLQFKLGIVPHPPTQSNPQLSCYLLINNPSKDCPICYNKMKMPVHLDCGHAFCIECWQ